jgi:hypothetical protein
MNRITHFRASFALFASFSASCSSVQSSQNVNTESAAPETIVLSSELIANAQICQCRHDLLSPDDPIRQTLSSWLSNVVVHSSSLMFQSFTNPSDALLTSCIPALTKSTLRTEFVCPSNVFTQEKSSMFQSFTVLSPLPVARIRSVLLNRTVQTPRLCPLHVPTSCSSPRAAFLPDEGI